MTYEKYNGRDTFVTLNNPANNPITHIAPKAFLSCKGVQSLKLPDSVEHIGDWAFAHMHGLTELTLPARPITFGKKVFLDCENLKKIHLVPDTSGNEGLALLLGAAVTILQDMSLLRPDRAASHDAHAQWLTDFDRAVADFVKSPDEQGFEPVFYGWFNDEDADSTQLPKYLHKRRCQKLELVFLRLRYDLHLQTPLKTLLQEYLVAHLPTTLTEHMPAPPATSTPAKSMSILGTVSSSGKLTENHSFVQPTGSIEPTHTITWELLPEYCKEEVVYIKIIEETGVLTAANIPAFLTHLQDASPEVIAYLLRLQSGLQEQGSFFDNFSL